MKKAIVLGLIFLWSSVASALIYHPPVKYAQELTITFALYDSNSPWRSYETAPAAADVHVFQDGASEAQATNAVTDVGRFFTLTLTAAEMTAALVVVDINDASEPPLFGDETIVIPTYGHASALGAFDLDAATVTVGANSDKTGYALSTSGIDAILDNTLSNNKVKQSLAWYVQRGGGGDPLAISGTAQAGGTASTIVLAADSASSDGAYIPCTITLLTGTGAPTNRVGYAYTGGTKTLTIVGTWPNGNPDATTTYRVDISPSSSFAAEGVAQGGTANTIQLAGGDVGADGLAGFVVLKSGTGSGSTVYSVTDTVDANDTLVISGTWAGASPDTTTYYVFTPTGVTVADTGTTAPGLSMADVQAALTAQGLTDTRAGYLEALAAANLPADVNTLQTRLPQTISFTSVGGTPMPQVTTNGWNGVAVAAPHTAGYPVVTIKDGTGTGEINTTSGAVTTDITGSYDVDDLMTWIQKTYYNLP